MTLSHSFNRCIDSSAANHCTHVLASPAIIFLHDKHTEEPHRFASSITFSESYVRQCKHKCALTQPTLRPNLVINWSSLVPNLHNTDFTPKLQFLLHQSTQGRPVRQVLPSFTKTWKQLFAPSEFNNRSWLPGFVISHCIFLNNTTITSIYTLQSFEISYIEVFW